MQITPNPTPQVTLPSEMNDDVQKDDVSINNNYYNASYIIMIIILSLIGLHTELEGK